MSKTSKTCSKLIKTLKNQQCDHSTDQLTDRVTYRLTCTQLKTIYQVSSVMFNNWNN